MPLHIPLALAYGAKCTYSAKSGVNLLIALQTRSQKAIGGASANGAKAQLSEEHPAFEAEYELQRVIGHGASGGVRAAVCRSTGQQVAIKSFRKHRLTAEELVSMRSELELLGAISHPGVVSLAAVYESETEVHIIMEKLHGGELFDRIQRGGRLTECEAAQLAAQILAAVSHLHSQRVVHRDIKLENLCYADPLRSCIKLIDLGFATTCSPNEKLTAKMGSLGYAAPEVLAGRGYDESADLWSVGSVMYAVLTGAPAFCVRDGSSEILRRSEAGLVDFDRPFQGLSEDAKSFVRALLSPDPAARPTAEEALQHPWLQGRKALPSRSRAPGDEAVAPSVQVSSSRPSSTHSLSGCFAGLRQSVVAFLDSLEAKAASASSGDLGPVLPRQRVIR